MGDLTNHIDFLFGKDKGYIYSPIKRKTGEWIPKWFSYPLERGNLIDWITIESRESDVYLSPGLWKEKKITPESIDHYNVAWIEFDGQEQPKWKDVPEPDYIVQTSTTTHQHCYWKLEEPITNAETIENINRRLTYYLEADSSGWDYQQVLRPPETVNYKHNVPTKQVKLVEKVHRLSAFDAAPEIAKPIPVFTYDSLLTVEEVLKAHQLPLKLQKRIKDEIVVHPHRSEFLMATGHFLAEAGLEPIEIVTCLYHIDCRIKKFVGREDQLRRLSEIASIAVFKVQRALYASVYKPFEIITNKSELNWVWNKFMHETSMSILTGQPGVGKTQLALDWSYRWASGLPVLGFEIQHPLRVAILSLEMDVIELQYIYKHHSLGFQNHELWNQNCFIIAPDIEGDLRSTTKTLQDIKPNILIIDSISELATEDLASESEAREVMKWMKYTRKSLNLAIMAIHHNRKASDANKKPRKLSDLYGSYLFAKATDTVFSLWKEEGRDFEELDTLKCRYDRPYSFNLERSPHLTFEMKVEKNRPNASDESTTDTRNTIDLDFGKKGDSNRHRNK